jgi:hypothetical protein
MEEAPGGMKVSIIVEEVGEESFETIKRDAIGAHLALRQESELRRKLQVELDFTLDKIIPRLLGPR